MQADNQAGKAPNFPLTLDGIGQAIDWLNFGELRIKVQDGGIVLITVEFKSR